MKTQNPLIGRSSGKFGTAIFQTQYGINVVRSKPVEVRNRNLPGQLITRQKFATAQAWVAFFLSIIRFGFAPIASGMSPYSKALGWYLSNAITGELGSYSIDYPNAMFTWGDLTGGAGLSIVGSDYDAVEIGFTDNSGLGNAIATDIPHAICYNATKHKIAISDTLTDRSDEYTFINDETFEIGDICYFWLYFTNTGNTLISDSQYVGTTTLE